MAVITVARQLGSAGTWVATRAAEELGYEYVDRQLVFAAAARAGVPEVALAQIDEFGLLSPAPVREAHDAYLKALLTVIVEAARRGNLVIGGYGGQLILSDFPGAFHVQVIAPFARRAGRIAERQGVSLSTAESLVRAADRRRALYLRRYYGVDWLDPGLYDLVVNTGRIEPPAAVRLIVEAVRAPHLAVPRSRP